MNISDLQCFVTLLICFSILTDKLTSANTTISFKIEENQISKELECYTDKQQFKFQPAEAVKIHAAAPIYLDDAYCVVDKQTQAFIQRKNFKNTEKENHIEAEVTITDLNKGLWRCTYVINLKNINNETTGTKEAVCDIIDVDVIAVTKKRETNIWQDYMFYIIGGIVGAVVILIIIIQTVIILKYRKKLVNDKEPLPRLSRKSRSDNDLDRYSATPRALNKKGLKREDSCIYQSLENLKITVPQTSPNATRPPMPLPDNDNIYDDGDTLPKLFAPEPPPTDTLPKKHSLTRERMASRGIFANQPTPAPKPKPAPMPEEYDYPDTMELTSLKGSLSRPQKKSNNPIPLPPRPQATKMESPVVSRARKPPCPVPVMSELENQLKKMRNNQKPNPTKKPPLPHKPQEERPAGPWSPGWKQDVKRQEMQKRSVLRPRTGLGPSTVKSPLVSRVQPMAKVSPIAKSPPVPLKPVGPYKPPVNEETYEEVSTMPGSSDEEEWTYEPLPNYNIYNI